MIEKAKALNREYLDKISFQTIRNSVQSLFDPGSVSLVISLIVFQHIPKHHSCRYMAELLQLLKPDGLFIFQLITKDIRSWRWVKKVRSFIRIRERLAMIGIGDHFHMKMHVLSKQEVCRTIRGNGGEVLEICVTNHSDPAYDGNLKFIDERDSIDYVSNLFIVRKVSGKSSNIED
jgi:cyclopropane fatty-acyl-phospholipid synthase-like methyltransferase